MIDIVATASFVFFLAMMAVFWVASRAERDLSEHLRAKHQRTCTCLNLPEGVDPIVSLAFLRFVWRREYNALGDSQLNRRGDRVRALVVSSAVLLLLFVAESIACALLLFRYRLPDNSLGRDSQSPRD